MTVSMKRAAILLSGTVAAGLYGSVAFAADVSSPASLPAVSAPNGKVEIGAGWDNLDDYDSDTVFRGGASFSFPVGDMFGIQADMAAVDTFGDTSIGGTLHAFTRDPNSYLLGAIGGYANAGDANVWYVGPEAELYLGNVSVEAVAGYMNVDVSNSSSSDKFFAIGDVALYATDNLRLSVGASSVAGFETGRAGLEWFMGDDMGVPASFKLDGRVGEDGFTSIEAGLSFYFGGDDKSLIRRHREDDPRNRSLDIFGATAGGAGLGNKGNNKGPTCDANTETPLPECPVSTDN